MAACVVCTGVCSSIAPRAVSGRRAIPSAGAATSAWDGSSWGDYNNQFQRAGGESSAWTSCSSSTVFGGASSSKTLRPTNGGRSSQWAGAARVGRSSRNVVCKVAIPGAVQIGNEHSGVEQSALEEEFKPGTRIRVKVPLTVYHVMKSPNLNLQGLEGEVKEVVVLFKGQPVSATLPLKVQFFINVDEKEVKFIAHLREDEVAIVE